MIIVESPSKIKTITKFLGSEYLVESSVGHIRDLPSKDIGIDINNHFLDGLFSTSILGVVFLFRSIRKMTGAHLMMAVTTIPIKAAMMVSPSLAPVLHRSLLHRQVSFPFLLMQGTCPPAMSR